MVEFCDGRIVRDTEAEQGQIRNGWYYTIKEFAELIDVPEVTVRSWIHRRIIESVNYYGRTYIHEDAKFHFERPWMNALRGHKKC